MDTIIEYLTFQHIWGVEFIFAKICIMPIASALIYNSQYRMYKRIREDSGETAEKWLSPILFALIILAVGYILEVIDNITDGLFLYAVFIPGFDIYSLISLVALLLLPAIAALIYRSQYKRYVEGTIGKPAKGKFLTPHHFGILIVLIEGAIVFAYVFYGAMMSV